MCFHAATLKAGFSAGHGGGKWSGQMQERKCTDCYCTFVFVGFWTAMVGVLCAAFWLGDPTLQRIMYGTDYNGHTCGVDHSHENGPNLLNRKRIIYPRVMQDVLMHAYKYSTDPEKINEIVEDPTQMADFVTDFHPFGVCIEECPRGGDYVCTYEWDKKVDKKAIQECYMKDGLELAADYLLSKVDGLGGKNCEQILANCFPTPVDNQDYFFRCLPLYRTGKDKIEECVEWYSDNNTDKTVHENYDCLAVKVTELKETIKPAKGDFLLDVVNEQVQMLNNILDDFFKAKFVIIVVGFICSVLLSFVWLVVLRFFAVVIVWASIVLVYILTGAAVILCYLKSDLVTGTDVGNMMGSLDSAQGAIAEGFGQKANSVLENVTAPMDFLFDSQNAEMWKYVAYVSTGVYVIFIIFGLIMLKKVVIAIKIIVETTNAIKDMPLIMLWPLFPSAFILVMICYWLYTAMFIGSMGAVKAHHVKALAVSELGNLTSASLFNNATIVDTKAFTPLDFQPAFQIYNIFMVMWTMGLINAISFTTMAGAFCRWYWSRGDERMKETFPLCRAYGRVMQYHFGTMAVGSFILATIRLVRFIMMYLEKRTRAAQRNNKCVKTLFKVVHCMLFLFDRCLKYLARQAYIMVAMYGYNFCKASIMAVMLITSNVLQVAAVNAINRYVMFLGKLVVVVSCVIAGYMWITYSPDFQGENELFAMLPVIAVIGIFGLSVASYVFNIYNVGVETILLCFCQDCMIHENLGDNSTKLFHKGMQEKIKNITQSNQFQKTMSPPVDEIELTEPLTKGEIL